jgi:putative phosphoribosyl transferase
MQDMLESVNDNLDAAQEGYDGRLLRVGAGALDLVGILAVPERARGLVLLACGLEADPHQRAIYWARYFRSLQLASLIVDLFTSEEHTLDDTTGYFRQNTEIMQQRIIGMADWLYTNPETENLTLGYLGSGASGTAALIAAAERPDVVAAVVAIGGQPDLASDALKRAQAPLLLIAPGEDDAAMKAHRKAYEQITVEKRLEQVRGTASFPVERQALDKIAELAGAWFARWLIPIV